MKHQLILICALSLLSGCESWFSVRSPISSEDATETELKSEQRQYVSQTAAQSKQLELELAAANKATEEEKLVAKREFDAEVRKIRSEMQTKLDSLTDRFQIQQEQADASFDRIAAEINAKITAIAIDQENKAAEFAEAFAALEELRSFIASISDSVTSIASGFGPFGQLLGAGIGLAGVAFGIKGRRNAQQMQEATTRIIDAIDVVKSADPQFAAKFKEHGTLLSDWMGKNAVDLVTRTQEQ